jgi:membrane protease YdiL (CAAX protease family)
VVLALSFPFSLIGAVTDLQLMPGLSASALMALRPAAAALLMFFVFLVGALGEELGWPGYVLDPLQDRWSALRADTSLGVIAVIWHLAPLLLMQRASAWIAYWCVYVMGSRILIVWLYNNTGKSVFGVTLFHATLNLSYMLFPVYGSHFDMRFGGLVMAFAVAIVIVRWGPGTLTGYPYTGSD